MNPESDFFTNNIVLFAALGIIIALILRMEIKRALSGTQTVTPAQAVQLINKEDALILDIREDNELAQGSIRGSKHYALSVLKQRLDELKQYADKPVIAYCKMGNRSNEACTVEGFIRDSVLPHHTIIQRVTSFSDMKRVISSLMDARVSKWVVCGLI